MNQARRALLIIGHDRRGLLHIADIFTSLRQLHIDRLIHTLPPLSAGHTTYNVFHVQQSEANDFMMFMAITQLCPPTFRIQNAWDFFYSFHFSVLYSVTCTRSWSTWPNSPKRCLYISSWQKCRLCVNHVSPCFQCSNFCLQHWTLSPGHRRST